MVELNKISQAVKGIVKSYFSVTITLRLIYIAIANFMRTTPGIFFIYGGSLPVCIILS